MTKKEHFNKPIPEICCPYDGMECGDQRCAFEAWEKRVEEYARKHIDYMFHTSSEQHCPRAFTEEERKAKCYRYRVYLAGKQKQR